PLNFHDKLQSEDLWLGYRSTLDRTCGGGKVIHDGGKQDLLTLEFEFIFFHSIFAYGHLVIHVARYLITHKSITIPMFMSPGCLGILQTVEIDWMTPHMLELRREAQVIMGSDPGHELLNG
ncbi:unnamed protein product, partial [Linum tenue]